MNLVDDENNNKTKTANMNKIFLLITLVILVIIMIVLYLLMVIKQQMLTSVKSGILVDGAQIKNLQLQDLNIENGTIYFPIKDIAESIGYKAYNGEYKVQSEDTDKCYLLNENESATFFENEKYVYKLNTKSEKKSQKYKKFEIAQPVKKINGKLYVSAEGLSIACNLKVKYDETNQIVNIYTLKNFETQFAKVTEKKGVVISTEENFENKKAMLKNWAVVQDDNKNYGIIDQNGTEILGLKYKSIVYDEYTDSFTIQDSSGKYGVWKIENSVVSEKIKNSYDSISLIDKEKELYLVSLNNKYGVISFDGQIVGQITYDKIGIDTSKFNVEDEYIMYDNLIPVQKDGKWGILGIAEKSEVIPMQYDGIGCDVSKDKSLENIIMVPEYGLVVVKKEAQYGLINWKCETIIDCVLSTVYYSNASGSKVAYMESAGEKYDIVKYLDDNGTIQRYQDNKQDDIFSVFDETNTNQDNGTNEETSTNPDSESESVQ